MKWFLTPELSCSPGESAGDGGWTRLGSAASTAGALGAPAPGFICIFSPSPSSISQKSELTFVNSLGGKTGTGIWTKMWFCRTHLTYTERSKICHQLTQQSCCLWECPIPSSPFRLDFFFFPFKSLENRSQRHEQSQLSISQSPSWAVP